jgi:anti-sigma B factor antagonist
METQTEYTVEQHNGTTIMRIVGDMDHYNMPRFRSLISDLVAQGRTTIVLDMSGVEFMDSGGMSALIFAGKQLSKANGRLLVADCNPRISRKLDIGGLSSIPGLLTRCTDLQQALEEARKPLSS